MAVADRGIRRVLVTGASSGIGAATTRMLARRGVEVFAAARRIDALRRVAESSRGRVHACLLDVADPSSVASLGATLHTVTGGEGVDALVNAAGWATIGPLETVAPEDLRAQLDVSALGPLRVVQAVLPAMRSRGSGRIVNVSSILGLRALAGHGAYCAGKFALEGLSEHLRRELASDGIEVALVQPGSVRTELTDLAADDLHARVGDDPRWQVAMRRLVALRRRMTAAGVEPEGIADAIVAMLLAQKMPPRAIVPRRGRVQVWSLGAARPLFRRLAGHLLGPTPPSGRVVTRARPIVLLTGAAGSVGRLAALGLAQAGARVFATDIDRDGLSALVAEARARGVAIAPSTMDVTDPAQIRITVAAIERATDGHGVDVVVNAAHRAEPGSLAHVSEAAMQRQLAVNVLGAFATTRAVLPGMRRRGAGRIVDVASTAGLGARPLMGLQHASRCAVEALDEAWRQELHAAGIRVVSIAGRTRPGGAQRDVARAIESAALGRNPKARYAVPWTSTAATLALPLCPTWITDRMWARAHVDS